MNMEPDLTRDFRDPVPSNGEWSPVSCSMLIGGRVSLGSPWSSFVTFLPRLVPSGAGLGMTWRPLQQGGFLTWKQKGLLVHRAISVIYGVGFLEDTLPNQDATPRGLIRTLLHMCSWNSIRDLSGDCTWVCHCRIVKMHRNEWGPFWHGFKRPSYVAIWRTPYSVLLICTVTKHTEKPRRERMI